MEYALATNPRVRDGDGLTIRADLALQFRRPSYPLDLIYTLEAGNLSGWLITPHETNAIPLDAQTESITMRESAPPPAARRYYRLRCTFQP